MFFSPHLDWRFFHLHNVCLQQLCSIPSLPSDRFLRPWKQIWLDFPPHLLCLCHLSCREHYYPIYHQNWAFPPPTNVLLSVNVGSYWPGPIHYNLAYHVQCLLVPCPGDLLQRLSGPDVFYSCFLNYWVSCAVSHGLWPLCSHPSAPALLSHSNQWGNHWNWVGNCWKGLDSCLSSFLSPKEAWISSGQYSLLPFLPAPGPHKDNCIQPSSQQPLWPHGGHLLHGTRFSAPPLLLYPHPWHSVEDSLQSREGKSLQHLRVPYLCCTHLLYTNDWAIYDPSLWAECFSNCPCAHGQCLLAGSTPHEPHCLQCQNQADSWQNPQEIQTTESLGKRDSKTQLSCPFPLYLREDFILT